MLLMLVAIVAACSSTGSGDTSTGLDTPADTTDIADAISDLDVLQPIDACRTEGGCPGDTGTDTGNNVESCTRNADCVAGDRCAPCDATSCAGCLDCLSSCVPHTCVTEATLVDCAMLRPDCVGDAVSVIRDGCWVCVDLATCTGSADDPGGADVADPGLETIEPADVPQDLPKDLPTDSASSDPGSTAEGTWIDPATSLRWQQPPTDTKYLLADATTYCSSLDLGGYADWRLPRIDELRSLIRGCPGTMTGGTCGVTNSCTKATCTNASCDGCTENAGPNGGCYWAPELTGNCRWYWSGDDVQDVPSKTWAVVYDGGYIIQSAQLPVIGTNNVRCVR
jgi:hypothetical protein